MKSPITLLLVILILSGCKGPQQDIEIQPELVSETVEQTVDELEEDTVTLEELLEESGEEWLEDLDYPDLDSASCPLKLNYSSSYEASKARVKRVRQVLSRKYSETPLDHQKAFLDSASQVFTAHILNTIIPHWYGTEWDYEGYTAVPNEGVVACGYFVSTTLRDMGLKLNRYRLAQKAASVGLKSIQFYEEVSVWSDTQIAQKMAEMPNGLYHVGLSNHMGYVYKENSKIYFIHSDYARGEVVIEETKDSYSFESTGYWVLPITGNVGLMEKWLTQEEIPILNS